MVVAKCTVELVNVGLICAFSVVFCGKFLPVNSFKLAELSTPFSSLIWPLPFRFAISILSKFNSPFSLPLSSGFCPIIKNRF